MKNLKLAYEVVEDRSRRQRAHELANPELPEVPLPDSLLTGLRLAGEYLGIVIPLCVGLWLVASWARSLIASLHGNAVAITYYWPEGWLFLFPLARWCVVPVVTRCGRQLFMAHRLRIVVVSWFGRFSVMFLAYLIITFLFIDLPGRYAKDDGWGWRSCLDTHGVALWIAGVLLGICYFSSDPEPPPKVTLFSGYRMMTRGQAREASEVACSEHVKAVLRKENEA